MDPAQAWAAILARLQRLRGDSAEPVVEPPPPAKPKIRRRRLDKARAPKRDYEIKGG